MLQDIAWRGLDVYFGYDMYRHSREMGKSRISSGIRAVGESLYWEAFAAPLMAYHFIPLAGQLGYMGFKSMYQSGEGRYATYRKSMMPYDTHYQDSEVAYERRQEAIGGMNHSYNIARQHARRMRG